MAANGKKLVIVESPAKAKTIAGYLGHDYVVESSIGHIRDLPTSASEIPARVKDKPWARLGVNVDEDFEPVYVVDARKKKVVADLKAKLRSANELLLATDEDREGEAIAWHLVQELKPKVPVRRMVFHEITRPAIERALAETREIDESLVDAQEARRILDRLYGYEVSPVLWRKVMQGLSAGRVQSVATRLVVERERERIAFVAAGYWDLVATFDPGAFTARLAALDGQRVAQGRDFGQDGKLRADDAVSLGEEEARGARRGARGRGVRRLVGRGEAVSPPPRRAVHDVDAAAGGQPQAPPLVAADDAGRAAALRERVHHLYAHRLDHAVRGRAHCGPRPGPRALRRRRGSRRAAQVRASREERAGGARGDSSGRRPVPDAGRGPARADRRRVQPVRPDLEADGRLPDGGRARPDRVGADRRGDEHRGRTRVRDRGTTITFRGFLLAYEEGRDEPADDSEDKRLPPLAEGDELIETALEPEGHSTSPPARYTEATLVKALEDRGIGRPSTYAAIMGTILDRGYVRRQGQALVPEFLAFAVVNLLEQHFPRLVDYEFTAHMEDDLDEIAAGEEARTEWLRRVLLRVGRRRRAEGARRAAPRRHRRSRDQHAADPRQRHRRAVGRYGPYLERDGHRQTLPPDLAPDELTPERAEELLAQGRQERELGVDPESGSRIVLRSGRYGPYVTEAIEGDEKPRTASLFQSMSPDTVTLEDALRLLTLPRTLGEADGEPVVAANGRYGPYVKKGKETRSLESEGQLFTATLEDALALLAAPKARRRRAAAPPLKELGDDPVSGKPIVVKDGRFGPYVTDGETNASLRAGDSVDTVTPERARELLQERRERGPAKPRRKAR